MDFAILKNGSGGEVEQIRSFIAIELPEEVKSGLKRIQDLLKSPDPATAKWVDLESIHLTLKFLGNVDVDKIDGVTRAIHHAVDAFTPFELNVDGLGCFPNPKRVQIIWVGLAGDIEKLLVLQGNIESCVSPLGFPTEKRPFTPHLTLARVREYVTPVQRQTLGEVVARTQTDHTLSFRVNSISLMKSRLTPAGAIYSRLDSVKLKSS